MPADAARVTDPTHQPGWHPDPWKQAQLRWHDGSDWTGHVHGDAPQPASAPAAPAAPPQPASDDADQSASEPDDAPRRPPLRLIAVLVGLIVVAVAAAALLRGSDDEGAAAPTAPPTARDSAFTEAEQARIQKLGEDLDIPQERIDEVMERQTGVADKTRVMAGIKNVVYAVEACAVRNRDGSFVGCDATGASAVEPNLAPLLQACGSPDGYCLKLSADTFGYSVSGMLEGSPAVTFTETHASDGTLSKTCAPIGPEPCATGRWG